MLLDHNDNVQLTVDHTLDMIVLDFSALNHEVRTSYSDRLCISVAMKQSCSRLSEQAMRSILVYMVLLVCFTYTIKANQCTSVAEDDEFILGDKLCAKY